MTNFAENIITKTNRTLVNNSNTYQNNYLKLKYEEKIKKSIIIHCT